MMDLERGGDSALDSRLNLLPTPNLWIQLGLETYLQCSQEDQNKVGNVSSIYISPLY